MLSLDSPEWKSLEHAYGSADDIPALLRELEAFPPHERYDDEPWHTLWSSLCHQSDIYSASYAAVPHILRIAAASPEHISSNYILLPTCIEASRLSSTAPPVPEHLASSYFEAIGRLPSIVAACFGRDWDDEFVRTATAALCAAKGHGSLASAILDLSEDVLEDFNAWVAAEWERKHPPTLAQPHPLKPLPPGTTFTT